MEEASWLEGPWELEGGAGVEERGAVDMAGECRGAGGMSWGTVDGERSARWWPR